MVYMMFHQGIVLFVPVDPRAMCDVTSSVSSTVRWTDDCRFTGYRYLARPLSPVVLYRVSRVLSRANIEYPSRFLKTNVHCSLGPSLA